MSTLFIITALVYILIGLGVAILQVYVFHKQVVAHFWGALIVSLIGTFAGGAAEFLLKEQIERFTHLLDGMLNIVPPVIGALLFTWILVKVSGYERGTGVRKRR